MAKIIAPIHCGKPAVGYAHVYWIKPGKAHSIEYGFKCKVCGSHRIPFESGSTAGFAAYANEMNIIRERAIAEEMVDAN